MIAVRKPPKALWLVAFAMLAASCSGDASPPSSDPRLAPLTSLPQVTNTPLPLVTTTTAQSTTTTRGGPELAVTTEPLPPEPRRLVRRAGDRGVFVLLDRALPTRLTGAFPDGVEVRRVGLAEAVRETRAFLAEGEP
ncbi:MAG: hypothetical protein ACE1Z9_09330 [Acidimicrobiia bacterium]